MECCEHVVATVASIELVDIQERTAEEPPNSKRSSRPFEPAKGINEIPVDPNSPNGKVLCIDAMLSSK